MSFEQSTIKYISDQQSKLQEFYSSIPNPNSLKLVIVMVILTISIYGNIRHSLAEQLVIILDEFYKIFPLK